MTYKCVNGLDPHYICELVNRKVNARPLRSDKLDLLEMFTTMAIEPLIMLQRWSGISSLLTSDIPPQFQVLNLLNTFLFKQYFE